MVHIDVMKLIYKEARNLKLRLMLAAIFLLAAFGSFGCESQEEQEINAAVQEGIETFEQGNLSKLAKLTTRDFVAYPGKLNRKSLMRKLYLAMRNSREIKVLHPTPEIEVDPGEESALVDLPLIVVTSEDADKELADFSDDQLKWMDKAEQLAEVQHLELSMIKQGDRWLVRTARFL